MAQALRQGPFPPKSISEIYPPQPVPFVAVAGEPADEDFGGEITRILGGIEPQPVTINVGDENLLDIIADLTARIEALEP